MQVAMGCCKGHRLAVGDKEKAVQVKTESRYDTRHSINRSPEKARVRCLNIRTTSLLVVIDDNCDGAGGPVQAEVESLRQQLLSLQKDRAGRLGELEKQAADLAFTSKVRYTYSRYSPRI